MKNGYEPFAHRVLKSWRHVSMTPKFSVKNKQHIPDKMASLSITSLIYSFSEEKKSIRKGENHYKSDHVESLSYQQGVLRGEVHARVKKKVYKVTMS